MKLSNIIFIDIFVSIFDTFNNNIQNINLIFFSGESDLLKEPAQPKQTC